MQQIRSQLESLSAQIDELSLRERALIFVAVVSIMVLGWNASINGRYQMERKQLQRELAETEARQEVVKRTTEEVLARHGVDPNRDLRHQLDTLQIRFHELEARKQALADSFIPPGRMAELLQSLLKGKGSLRFVSLETAPAEPVFAVEGQDVATSSAMPIVFRHGLTLEFDGDYFDMLAYLRELEKQPLFWDSVDYRVRTYPQASVRLKVYTLSFQREWLGV